MIQSIIVSIANLNIHVANKIATHRHIFLLVNLFRFRSCTRRFQSISRLLAQNNYEAIKNLFSSFLMTLLELSSHISYQYLYLKDFLNQNNALNVQNITASPLTYQLFEFLKQIMIRMPVGDVPLSQESLLSSYHPKIYFYQLILQEIIKDKQKIFKQTLKSNEFEYIHNQRSLAYFQSLRGYYTCIQILTQIKKGQKPSQEQLTTAIECYKERAHLFIDISAYEKYRLNFAQLIKKLKFIMQPTSNPQNKPIINLQNITNEHSKKIKIQKDAQLSEFYFMWETNEEKEDYIHKYLMSQFIRERMFTFEMLEKIQLLLYYHLNSLEKLEHKINIYTYLLGVKVFQNQGIKVMEEFNHLNSICRPSLKSVIFLCYCLFSISASLDITQTMEGLLKAYPKPENMGQQSSNKLYLELVVLTLLIFRTKLKVTNRKQLVDKILGIPQIIEHMNNIKIIDFMIGVLFCGKQIEFRIGLEQSEMSQLISIEQFETQTRKFLVNGYKNQATVFERPDQLYEIFKMLVKRRLKLSVSNHSKFIQLILLFFSIQQQKSEQKEAISQQMNLNSLKQALKIISQMTLSTNQYCPDYFIQMQNHDRAKVNHRTTLAYELLFWNLASCGFYLEAVVCLELGEFSKFKSGKLSYVSIERVMNMNQYYYQQLLQTTKQFNYTKSLLSCLMNYDIIQILMQKYPNDKLFELATEWLTKKEQNYENVLNSRKLKKLQIKRNRFIGVLWNKIMIDSDNQ